MQNVQNAAEIQQRVINLVELYRTKVGKESKIAKDAKADKEYWDSENINAAIELNAEGVHGPFSIDLSPDVPEEWKKTLRVNDHLLGHFYSVVAGKGAEERVLCNLLPDYYDATIFTQEEESFLRSHFKEMVNYIIQTPCDDLESVREYDDKDIDLIPQEVLKLVDSRITIAHGATIYNPYSGFAQFTTLYPGRKFFCEESYEEFYNNMNTFKKAIHSCEIIENTGQLQAWMRVALYANNVNVDIIDNGKIPAKYDVVLSYLPVVYGIEENQAFAKAVNMTGMTMASKIATSYRNLNEGGIMVLLMPYSQLYNNEKRTTQFKAFFDMLVNDRVLTEVIQLPSFLRGHDELCLLVIRKGWNNDTTTFIDARFAAKSSSRKDVLVEFDMTAFNTMINNGGNEDSTGLRKMVQISASQLNGDLLLPQVYVIERPLGDDCPVPLSSLCSLVSTKIGDVDYDLPFDTPWVRVADLSETFNGPLDIYSLERADCPNNPPHTDDYVFGKNGDFADSRFAQHTSIAHRVLTYRHSYLINNKNEAVLFLLNNGGNGKIQTALLTNITRPIAARPMALCPKKGIDAMSLLALINMPIVYRQMLAYQQFGLSEHLDDILVPTNKRIIQDEIQRLMDEFDAYKQLNQKLVSQNTEYKNEVRMRKHDLRPHLRQLASTERLMLHYIEESSDMDELKSHLKRQLDQNHEAISCISAIVDHLSDEEHFGKAELVNIDKFLESIELNHNDDEGFAMEYNCDKESFRNAGFAIPDLIEKWEQEEKEGMSYKEFIHSQLNENLPLYVEIAPVDLQRLVGNIIENARKHGLTDSNRKDYYIDIDLAFDLERKKCQIDFSNNGNPLPEGMTRERFGIRGERAGITGGSGSGGYIVKSIVNHYGGDYDIFYKDGVTTVRLLLPIATI